MSGRRACRSRACLQAKASRGLERARGHRSPWVQPERPARVRSEPAISREAYNKALRRLHPRWAAAQPGKLSCGQDHCLALSPSSQVPRQVSPRHRPGTGARQWGRRPRRASRRSQTAAPPPCTGPATSRGCLTAAPLLSPAPHIRVKCMMPSLPLVSCLRSTTVSVARRRTSSCVSLRTNAAGLPPHTCLPGITLAGGTTVPGNRMALLETTEPSMTMERSPMTAMSSTRHDRSKLPAPTVTEMPIVVVAGRPVGPFLHASLCKRAAFPATVKGRSWMAWLLLSL